MHYVQKKITCFLAWFPEILPNSSENYRHYNFQAFANISRNFLKISGNIKFPEKLQPYMHAQFANF